MFCILHNQNDKSIKQKMAFINKPDSDKHMGEMFEHKIQHKKFTRTDKQIK